MDYRPPPDPEPIPDPTPSTGDIPPESPSTPSEIPPEPPLPPADIPPSPPPAGVRPEFPTMGEPPLTPPPFSPQAPPPGSTLPPDTPSSPEPLSPQDERTWAMLAHLSVLANLVTGFLGPVGALAIYLIYKDRSRYVAFHALQSFVFQLIFWVGGGAMIGIIWAVTGMLSAVLVGLICIPFAILATIIFAVMPLVALIYGIIGAIQVSQGQDFRYWLVGDWARNTLLGV